jgi:uncharacterized membrane protein
VKKITDAFQKVSDWASIAFGSWGFFVFHILWWGVWIAFAIEPFPYGLLTLIVSLESILLSGLILNATNRSGEEDRRIITNDLKLDQETHNHIEELRRHVKSILEHIKETKNGTEA